MQNKLVPATIVGTMAGLILGFFAGIAYRSKQAPSTSVPPLAQQEQAAAPGLPENHPPKEVMEKVSRLLEQVEKDPNDKDSRIQLGNVFYDMGQYQQAIKWYAAALELDPRNVDVRTDMGTAYHFLGDNDRALQEFAVSLSVNPTHPQTLQNMGWVRYSGKKDYQGALEAWNKLLSTNPGYQNTEQVKKQIEQAKAEMEGKKG
ncbi:MAG: tetratricopeptide repeat protein [Acidobacteria bacterium]|nr:tetratricopeptide repeat protein [Acidobacteriota bacterium]